MLPSQVSGQKHPLVVSQQHSSDRARWLSFSYRSLSRFCSWPTSHSASLCMQGLDWLISFVSIQVDKLSNQHLRHGPAAASNYWAWSQNSRFGAPPGPPPRPIHGGSSPSQAPPSLSLSGRRYGGSHGTTRSPTSSMLHNPPYQPSQVHIKKHTNQNTVNKCRIQPIIESVQIGGYLWSMHS